MTDERVEDVADTAKKDLSSSIKDIISRFNNYSGANIDDDGTVYYLRGDNGETRIGSFEATIDSNGALKVNGMSPPDGEDITDNRLASGQISAILDLDEGT